GERVGKITGRGSGQPERPQAPAPARSGAAKSVEPGSETTEPGSGAGKPGIGTTGPEADDASRGEDRSHSEGR
uniref:hypothetical protein n=1 Tax=Streptomyces sp. IBSBF 2806 TaxID=2903529 RepID=UPI003FA73129